MKVTNINIKNYRRIMNIELNLSDDITIIAGANNSGKTTVINLIKGILGGKRFDYKTSDIPIKNKSAWSVQILPIIMNIFGNTNDIDEFRAKVSSELFQDKKLKQEFELEVLEVKFGISYEENDDIRNFVNYLMDFDMNKRAFSFIYTYILDSTKFLSLLENNYIYLKS